jgi:hypothetical protein
MSTEIANWLAGLPASPDETGQAGLQALLKYHEKNYPWNRRPY